MFNWASRDQFGGAFEKKYKSKKLKEVLQEISQFDTAKQKSVLEKNFDEWKGLCEQVDDVTIVGLRF